MIKVKDFGMSFEINGIPEQIAMELTVAARGVREIFVRIWEKSRGMSFLNSSSTLQRKQMRR